MALATALVLCPFTVASDIFTLKKNIAKMHYNNIRLNVSDNAPLAIYQVALTKQPWPGTS
jgi:type IV secretory pathway protease TraF